MDEETIFLVMSQATIFLVWLDIERPHIDINIYINWIKMILYVFFLDLTKTFQIQKLP